MLKNTYLCTQNHFTIMKNIHFPLLLIIVLSLSANPINAQEFESATDAVRNMQVGWNLGNTLESNSGDTTNMWIEKWSQRKTSDYETAWGQALTTQALIHLFKEAGFNAIRVPVTWYPHTKNTWNISLVNNQPVWSPTKDPIGTDIDPVWMARVKEVVDYVINEGMYCIINIHHDTGTANTHWLIADTANYNAQHERFAAIWKQIAEEFKDYDEHLLFEGYNEMTDPANSWCFASFGTSARYNAGMAKSAYEAINRYAQLFVNTVRATGGNNAARNLIVSTYAGCDGHGTWNNHLNDPLKNLKLPQDEATNHLIFEVHSYWDTKNFSSASVGELTTSINNLKNNLSVPNNNTPVIIGEWGSADDSGGSKPQQLNAFAEAYSREAKKAGFTTFYWMGLVDGKTDRVVPQWTQPAVRDAILKGYRTAVPLEEVREARTDSRIFSVMGQEMGTDRTSLPSGLYIQSGKTFFIP